MESIINDFSAFNLIQSNQAAQLMTAILQAKRPQKPEPLLRHDIFSHTKRVRHSKEPPTHLRSTRGVTRPVVGTPLMSSVEVEPFTCVRSMMAAVTVNELEGRRSCRNWISREMFHRHDQSGSDPSNVIECGGNESRTPHHQYQKKEYSTQQASLDEVTC